MRNNKQYLEDIINEEIIEKYSIDLSNQLNRFPVEIRNDFKFIVLRLDLEKDINKIYKKVLEPIKKLKNTLKNNTYDLKLKKEIINIYSMMISEVERKTFGEVSTPMYDNPGSVDEQLKLLEPSFWKNPYAKILDPCCGVGNYEIVLVSKFMDGLKEWEPNQKKRYKHIMENMIYVVDITTKNLWIYYHNFDHDNELKLNYYLGSFIDNPDFDSHMKNEWKIEEFDLICTNPPYNESRGDNNASKDLYNFFVEKSEKISNKVIMITPSRWFIKSQLKKFRENMLKNFHLKTIKHFDDNHFFDGCDIKGGISYFLIDKEYNGNVFLNSKELFLDGIDIIPNLLEDDVFTILEKIKNFDNINSLFNSQGFYNIKTNDKRLTGDETGYKCFVSKQKGSIKYFDKKLLIKKDKLEKIKVAIPAASGKGGIGENFYNRIVLLKENELCNESFVFFDFETLEEANNFISYLSSNFISFLVRLRKIKQHVTSDIFKWVPKLDFKKSWSDEELYKFFNLTQNEINLIEKITH